MRGVARGEGIVVEVARDHRGTEVLGESDRLGLPARHHHAAADEDHRETRLGQESCGRFEALTSARRSLDRRRDRDLGVELAVEMVSRDVEDRLKTI